MPLSVDGLPSIILYYIKNSEQWKYVILGAEVEKNYKRFEDRLGYNQLQSVHT